MDASSESELPRMEYDVSLKCNVCGHRWEDKASMDGTVKPMGIGYEWNPVHFCPYCGKIDNEIDGDASREMR
jgi:hypothetical protein